MDLEVLKFGGSSLASAEALKRVQQVLLARKAQQKIVVCSAMGGVTSALLLAGRMAANRDLLYRKKCADLRQKHVEAMVGIGLAENRLNPLKSEIEGLLDEVEALCNGVSILGELSHRSADALVAYGERMAVPMVVSLLEAGGLHVRRVDARDWIATDDAYGAANVDWAATAAAILMDVDADLAFDVLVTEGFIGKGPDGSTTTLGRGGSDYTASLIARAIGANFMEKSTDVPGMMTADPRLVPSASVIDSMSYEEALELCHFGARVIYHPTIEPLRKSGVPLIVRSTFAEDGHPGTRIVAEPESRQIVRGLSSMSEVALITLVGGGIIGRPGFSRRVFTALAQAQINVILITQSSSEHTITLAIAAGDVPDAERALQEEFDADMRLGRLENIRIDLDLSIVALVGGGMQSETGVSGRAFASLGANGINVRAIAQGSTERNISIVVASSDVPDALRALHQAFFEPPQQTMNLLCFGVGQVGKALLDQTQAAAAHLRSRGVVIRVVGIVRSHKHLLDADGIDLSGWEKKLAQDGVAHESASEVLDRFVAMSQHGESILVDNTASAEVAGLYRQAAAQGLHIVASNKIAAAGPAGEWAAVLAELAQRSKSIRFETNVGAALPVMDTLQMMLATGDEVHRIEAVLSGSLNFIFSEMEGGATFADAVLTAKELGYTEPDPRLDLSGEDVARKILILARLTGRRLELSDVKISRFLPDDAFDMEQEEFLNNLPRFHAAFESGEEGVWRFVATLDQHHVHVGLKRLPRTHPFAALQGSDNQIRFYTRRYAEAPLVIQGSGAGAERTASGVFSDILRLVAFQFMP
jgi:aspartokinase/homoserine dehydrogenase 1